MRARAAKQIIGGVAALAAGIALGGPAGPQEQATAARPQAAKPEAAASPGEAEVRGLLRELTRAYNAADAKAVAAQFTADAILVDGEGTKVEGLEAISKRYTDAFAGGPTAKLSGEVESIRLVTPDVASVAGRFKLEGEGGEALGGGGYHLLALRKDGRWKVAELRDQPDPTPEPTPTAAERLKELEWLVGDWVDEGQDVKVITSVKWADSKNFLIRTYKVQVAGQAATGGTQWIGWDPQAEQFRSWVFDDEGGFGQGLWTHVGDAWVIKASGILADGRSTSATQTLQKVNDDAIRFRSSDRMIGDESLAEIGEVLMVRKPPAPGAGGAKR
jgi:uncharacterized protein (TIGR02246 family)